jgi:hypothetical protein
MVGHQNGSDIRGCKEEVVKDDEIKVWTALVPGRYEDLKKVLWYEKQKSLKK